ncbi:hypothetical protein ACQPZ2_44140 (plasmid) [Nocardia pseudovaccinii]|uniref:hypothetical protein n=1 Tax=Nocardia pseudovaccinii TaxID=189540 RepID=UPI003D8C0937
MFRRPKSRLKPPAEDQLIVGELTERVQTAHDRLAHQYDPALTEALSVRELAAEREAAERERDHQRSEKLAQLQAVEVTSAQVRRATAEIVRADATDLVLARRALAEQRRESSPHAQLASLYRIKKWSGRALAGVVVAAMVFSAANVQHNLAPGGPGEPLYWASYLLEALISTVLVVFMLTGSAVARWGVTDGETAIRWTEGFLLAGSLLLNTYPYLRDEEWFDVSVHSVAPVMIGVALLGHDAVSKRLGAAIAKASLLVPAGDDDITDRLTALTRTHTTKRSAGVDVDDTARHASDMDEFEREFTDRARRAEMADDAQPIARAPIAARAENIADETARADRETTDRAPIARGETDDPRAETLAPIALDDVSPIARDDATMDTERAVESELIVRAQPVVDRAPIAEHSPAELGADRAPIAAHEDETTPAETDPEDDVARDRRTVVTLVRGDQTARAARETTDRAPRAGRSPIAREPAVDGALARATDRSPIARGGNGSGPFARVMSRAEAAKLARAVRERGRSKQPIEVLTAIYEAHSQGHTATYIGKEIVHLAHSTVGRAIEAADEVAGPRAIN